MKKKILHIAWFDCAGMIEKFQHAFEKYSDKYEMRSIILRPSVLNYHYDMNGNSVENIENTIKETDIVIIHPFINGGEHTNHIMNDWDNLVIQGRNIIGMITKYNKRVVFYLNGSNNLRAYAQYYNQILEKIPLMCSTPDLKVLFPSSFYAPVIIDIDLISYTPLEDDKKIEFVRITHCPTDPFVKNTAEFENAVVMLRERFFFDYKRIMNLPHPIAINVKRTAHVNFDHIQGYYGVNSFESAAQGVVNFVKMNEEYKPIFSEVAGTDTVPFVHINNMEEFSNQFEYYLRNTDDIKIEGNRARKWMEKYWHPTKHVKRMEDYFDMLLEKL